MFHLVLYEPEIPPNTGNVIRLCANTSTQLHLIEPLGFSLEDKQLRRAGLDYHEWATVKRHPTFEAFRETVNPIRIFAYSTHGKQFYTTALYQPGDALMFGSETRGLPVALRESLSSENILRIPMHPHQRSLNLSNAAAVVLFEAWRQQGFPNGI
ncbi:MAG: tRNA (uridine(34)/cytosine(34)/5-carboxymethylaminomethyluridine(34)-2'-O)-methyltransferase TrmL [Gammaproteobacteria bacterium]